MKVYFDIMPMAMNNKQDVADTLRHIANLIEEGYEGGMTKDDVEWSCIEE